MPPVRHPAERNGPGQEEWLHQEHAVRLIEMPPDEELHARQIDWFISPSRALNRSP